MTDKVIQIKDADDNNLFPVTNYNNNVNFPSINGVPLIGNKTLDELGMTGVGKKLLWQNPLPAAAFNGQTVTLSDSPENYDALLFVSLYQGIYHTDFVMVGSNTFTIVSYKDSTTASSSDTTLAWRNVTISGKAVTINNAMYNSASAGGYNRNDLCVPIYIYGVKFSGTDTESGYGSGIKVLWSAPAAASRSDIGSATTYTLSDTADFYIIKSNYDKSESNNYTYTTVFDNKRTSAAVVGLSGQWLEVRSYLINGTSFTVYPAYANKGGGTPSADPGYCYPIEVYGVYLRPTTINQYNYSLPSVNNSNLVDLIYPIGSIYASTSSANPGTIVGGTWTQLSRNNYNTKQWPTTTTQVASGSNATTTLQVTTNGSPIFLLFTGDVNGNDNGSSWAYVRVYRGSTSGTIVAQHLLQTAGGASTNETFSIGCIDVVSAGTYTYTFYIGGGSGKFQLCESSTSVSCMAFEIGADPSIYKWRRTS